MNPSASAPSSTASCASGKLVMPQILIFVSKQLLHLAGDVFAAQQRFANEYRVRPRRSYSLHIGSFIDSTFGDDEPVPAHPGEPFRGLPAHRKISQVAGVYTHDC